MITFLNGVLVDALPTHAVVDVGGVGYHLQIPLSSYDKLPRSGEKVRLLTHLQVREDAHVLYGFMSEPERDLFKLLIAHVSGIGPKSALDILSGMPVASFKACVVAGDIAALSRCKGIGKKTAERIVVELKDKVGVAAAWEAASAENSPSAADKSAMDAVLALIALGYKQVEAHKVVKKVQADKPEASEEELIKEALKQML
jgi:Holliday junction DNA helicase RuvA